MTATTKPVDVTKVLNKKLGALFAVSGRVDSELVGAIDLVAELIAADVEYDEAWIAWRNGPKNMQSDHPIVVRLGAAKERRAAALAAIQGENVGGGGG